MSMVIVGSYDGKSVAPNAPPLDKNVADKDQFAISGSGGRMPILSALLKSSAPVPAQRLSLSLAAGKMEITVDDVDKSVPMPLSTTDLVSTRPQQTVDDSQDSKTTSGSGAQGTRTLQ